MTDEEWLATPKIDMDDFEIWRCLRPYPKLDRILAQAPRGIIIKRKHRAEVYFKPGPLLGPGICYANEQGIWHAEQDMSRRHIEQEAKAKEILAKIKELKDGH